jgi:hypothetical protein
MGGAAGHASAWVRAGSRTARKSTRVGWSMECMVTVGTVFAGGGGAGIWRKRALKRRASGWSLGAAARRGAGRLGHARSVGSGGRERRRARPEAAAPGSSGGVSAALWRLTQWRRMRWRTGERTLGGSARSAGSRAWTATAPPAARAEDAPEEGARARPSPAGSMLWRCAPVTASCRAAGVDVRILSTLEVLTPFSR